MSAPEPPKRYISVMGRFCKHCNAVYPIGVEHDTQTPHKRPKDAAQAR